MTFRKIFVKVSNTSKYRQITVIFTFVNLKNLYSFDNIHVDLSYDRKLKDNPIENEFLIERPNFKFKKVCVISGANASGKTTFGRAMCNIQNFLSKCYLSSEFLKSISDKKKDAEFMIEFATTNDYKLHRMYVVFNSEGDIQKQLYVNAKIGKNDSCKQTRAKLDKMLNNKEAFKGARYYHYQGKSKNKHEAYRNSRIKFSLSKMSFHDSGWAYLFSENSHFSTEIRFLSAKLLYCILKTFDPSIHSVKEIFSRVEDESTSPDIDGFNIRFNNGDAVQVNKQSEVNGKERLSRGTFDAIHISELIARVIADSKGNTYFLDEGLVYCHTEIEQAVLNLIIDKLSENSQFFYTTHNHDILELNLPIHSFLFFKKDEYSTVIQPEFTFQKNDRTLLNYVKNNVFRTLPNTNYLDKLLLE